jgi:hypothetical protein
MAKRIGTLTGRIGDDAAAFNNARADYLEGKAESISSTLTEFQKTRAPQ